MSPQTIALIILALATLSFIIEKIPLALTSMLIVVSLIGFNILDPQEAFSGFSNTTIILFAAIFVVGAALQKTHFSDYIGNFIMKRTQNERILITATFIAGVFMGSFISSTGVAAILTPILIGVAHKTGVSRSKLLLPMAHGASLGGGVTLIGGPGKIFALTSLEALGTGQTYSFFDFTVAGLPIAIIGILYVYFGGYKLLPDYQFDEEAQSLREDKGTKKDNRLSGSKEILAYVIIIATVLAMIFQDVIGVSMYLSAVIGAILLVLLGVLNEQEALSAISLKTIILFAGVLPLSTALTKTGAGDLIADTTIALLGGTQNPYIITAVIFTMSVILTQVMSNTAAIALFCPLAGVVALKIGADPRALIMAACAGSICSVITPISSPPQAFVYGPGKYTFQDYLKFGLPLAGLIILFAIFYFPIVWPFF